MFHHLVIFMFYISKPIVDNVCDLTKSDEVGFGWSEVQPSETVKSLLYSPDDGGIEF